MKITVRGVRSVDIEMNQPERAAEFYSKIWNLTEVERRDGSIWFCGTGAYHHILAIHPAKGPASMRRLTFAAANRDTRELKRAVKQVRKAHKGEVGTFFAWLDDGADDDARAALRSEVPATTRALASRRHYRRTIAPVWSD